MKIAIDLDNVVLDTTKAYLEHWHPHFGPWDFKNYYMLDVLGIGVEQFLREWHAIPLEKIGVIGGDETVKLLKRLGVFNGRDGGRKDQIFFLTSNNGWGCLRICHWLLKRGITLPIYISEKKEEWVEKMGVDILIDDNGGLSRWLRPDQLILIDQPWNKGVDGRYDRFNSVKDAFEYRLWDRMAQVGTT